VNNGCLLHSFVVAKTGGQRGVNKMQNAENKMRNGIYGIMLRNDV